jgi:hypothetical protein
MRSPPSNPWTSSPSRANACAISTPMAPRPITPDPRRQVFLLEQRVRGQDAVAEGAPRLRHDRAGAGGQHDLVRLDHAVTNGQPVRTDKLRITLDVSRTEILGRRQDAGDEVVPQRAHPAEHGRYVGREGLPAPDAELVELRASVEGIGCRDQGLGGHASHAGTGRTVGCGIDQDKVFGLPAHFAKCGEPGRASADNGDLNPLDRIFLACFLGRSGHFRQSPRRST